MGTTQRVHSAGTAALTGGAALTAAALIAAILILAASHAARADTPPPAGDPVTVAPQENFLSSLKQAFKQDFDHAVVRGQFEVGTPPDTHRYYCLIDTKTGKRPPNGVSGQTSVRADGMTGIKVGAVSLYACDSAEQQGILVTSGYVLSASIPHVAEAPKPPPPAPAAAPLAPAAAATPAVVSPAAVAPLASPAGKVDVAGVKLGMSPDEVRGVLKARRLLNYLESSATLGRGDDAYAGASLRFVNVIAAWTGSSAPAESYEVMFTPVPGRERVMAIVHTQAFPGADAPSVAVWDAALARKYGGFAATSPLPDAPTWRVQESGDLLVGDSCERRSVLGGLAAVYAGGAVRPNLALKTAPEEFRSQIERCGVAIVTADRALDGDKRVTRFTVTAYAPAVAFDGAAQASPMMQSTGNGKAATHGVPTL